MEHIGEDRLALRPALELPFKLDDLLLLRLVLVLGLIAFMAVAMVAMVLLGAQPLPAEAAVVAEAAVAPCCCISDRLINDLSDR